MSTAQLFSTVPFYDPQTRTEFAVPRWERTRLQIWCVTGLPAATMPGLTLTVKKVWRSLEASHFSVTKARLNTTPERAPCTWRQGDRPIHCAMTFGQAAARAMPGTIQRVFSGTHPCGPSRRVKRAPVSVQVGRSARHDEEDRPTRRKHPCGPGRLTRPAKALPLYNRVQQQPFCVCQERRTAANVAAGGPAVVRATLIARHIDGGLFAKCPCLQQCQRRTGPRLRVVCRVPPPPPESCRNTPWLDPSSMTARPATRPAWVPERSPATRGGQRILHSPAPARRSRVRSRRSPGSPR